MGDGEVVPALEKDDKARLFTLLRPRTGAVRLRLNLNQTSSRPAMSRNGSAHGLIHTATPEPNGSESLQWQQWVQIPYRVRSSKARVQTQLEGGFARILSGVSRCWTVVLLFRASN